MSFRRFVYYCAVWGAWSALAGWLLGWLLAPAVPTVPDGAAAADSSLSRELLLRSSVVGLFLGLAVALGLSVLDARWNLSLRRIGLVALRVGTAVLVGALGGLLGGLLAQVMFGAFGGVGFVIGWTLTGTLVGISIGAFELLAGAVRRKDVKAARNKLLKGLLGGTVGGLLGGAIALGLRVSAAVVFVDKDENRLLSPTALGFVALGACIGLLVGLAQVVLKEAWIRVEAGFRPGREMILAKESTSVGRAEGSDIPLFGDAAVERLHARIVLASGRYYLEQAGPFPGTFVNDYPVQGRVALSSGDQIRIGRSVLRFFERQKRTA
jgi:hypothetical protein